MNDLEHERLSDYRIVQLGGAGAEIGAVMARMLRRVPSPFRAWPWEEDYAFLQGCASIVGEIAPWLWDELATFADGLDLRPEQGLFVRAGSLPHGCSAVAWRGYDGRVLTGRTYDFYVRMRTRHLLVTRPDQGFAHVGMNGGLAGGRYDGLNEHGLFVALHKVMADRPATVAPGVPYHLVLRLALQCCRTAEEAAELIMRVPHLASFNYTVADPSGALIALECYPGEPVQRRDGDDVLAVTNHYESPSLARFQGRRPTAESRRRKAALEAVGARWGDGWNATLDAISDHENGVCCHREFSSTLWAGVFDLGAKLAEYSFGAPCRNPLVAYDVPRIGEEQRTGKQRTNE
ncbi:MAG TPA: C45 family peptidase [Herpetosiphonaceae bacterium]